MSEQHTWVRGRTPEECEHDKGACVDCPFACDCTLTAKECQR